MILPESSNGFAGLLYPERLLAASGTSSGCNIIAVAEPSAVISIVLHTIYGSSCAQDNPSTLDLITAVEALHKYGVSVQRHLTPETPLLACMTARLRSSSSAPLHFYALAGKYDLYDLAVRASSHLLAVDISDIPLDIVERMGPIYLKRLIVLQLGRQEVLKELLLAPPETHPFTRTCEAEGQATLALTWQLFGAYFIWEMRPGK